MPSLVRRQHDAYRFRAQLRGLASAKPVGSLLAVDENAIDEEFATQMLQMPNLYPAYRGMSVNALTRLVRSWRVEAEAARRTKE